MSILYCSILVTRQVICCYVASHPPLAGYSHVPVWVVMRPVGPITIVASLLRDRQLAVTQCHILSLMDTPPPPPTWCIVNQARIKSQSSRRRVSTMRVVTIDVRFVTCIMGGITCTVLCDAQLAWLPLCSAKQAVASCCCAFCTYCTLQIHIGEKLIFLYSLRLLALKTCTYLQAPQIGVPIMSWHLRQYNSLNRLRHRWSSSFL